MKALWGMIMGAALSVAAAEEVKLPPFTNSVGIVVSNAVAVKALQSGLQYSISGGGGVIPWAKVSSELKEKFGMTPLKQMEAEIAELKKKHQQANQLADAAMAAELKALRDRILATRCVIWGKVLQVVDDGLMVDAGSEADKYIRQSGLPLNGYNYGSGDCYYGRILLTDYPAGAKLVEGDIMKIIAYPNGSLTYKSVSGGEVTCRVFTFDPDKVNSPATPAEMKAIRGPRTR